MSFPAVIVDELSELLIRELEAAQVGHCLRVDHIDDETAGEICEVLRRRTAEDVAAFVLDLDGSVGEYAISTEHAVELRNRKRHRLCLLVPARFGDVATSSLANSFAAFDLQGALTDIGRRLQQGLSPEHLPVVRRVKAQLTGNLEVATDRWLDFLGCVAEDPKNLGEALWRVGLVPDLGDDVIERIDDNARCVRAMAHPARPQSTVLDRLASAGVEEGAIKETLESHLRHATLRDRQRWTQSLLDAEPPLTFDRWRFADAEPADLTSIVVTPFLKASGEVEKWSKLQQPNGVGTQPYADAKGKVAVKWRTDPKDALGIARWSVALIPSRDEHPDMEDAAELPAVDVPASRRTATLDLDLELDDLTVRAAQVRITGLDELGRELRNAHQETIEGLSTEFWLADDVVTDGGSGGGTKKDTVPSLGIGRVRAVLRTGSSELQETAASWSGDATETPAGEPAYWTVTLDQRHLIRVATSPILNRIESQLRDAGAEAIGLRGRVSIAEHLRTDSLTAVPAAELGSSEVAVAFLKRREEVLRLLGRQEIRGFVATAEWTSQLSTKVRGYAGAYRDLLDSAEGEELQAALQLDTVQLEIEYSANTLEVALITPLHPARLLWYSAYHDLLKDWEARLAEASDREDAIDLELLARVEPTLLPAILPSLSGQPLLFARNLGLFWGVSIPLGTSEPARRVADVAELVGASDPSGTSADLPPRRVADEISAYRDVHPYLETLRVDVVTPGSGAYLADIFRSALRDQLDPDHRVPNAVRLELTSYVEAPVPTTTPELESLLDDVYEAQPRGRRSHLAPLFSIAHREVRDLADVVDRDLHLTLLCDRLRPQVEPADPPAQGDSAAFYGLLTRLVSTFSSGQDGAVWHHYLTFPDDAPREKHPEHGPYTQQLVDTQRSLIRAFTRQMGSDKESLRLQARVDEADIATLNQVHHSSDWVITLDRYMGVELFDDPSSGALARLSRSYLIDYSPEFLDGIGHRMLVTTSHREEIAEILDRAMYSLGFAQVEDSVGQVLDHLKAVSGRLALRVVGDENRAREAVSLGVVIAYLRSRGDLDNTIIVPVDAHPELFGVAARRRSPTPRKRCDLLLIRAHGRGLAMTFVEVKSRGGVPSQELMYQMSDQMEATEEVVRDLFFRPEGAARVDHGLQRARLASMLGFYLDRARRHGLFPDDGEADRLRGVIARLETSVPDLRADRQGFIINLHGTPQPPEHVNEATIHFVSAKDLLDSDVSIVTAVPPPIEEEPRPEARTSSSAPPSQDAPETPTPSAEPEPRVQDASLAASGERTYEAAAAESANGDIERPGTDEDALIEPPEQIVEDVPETPEDIAGPADIAVELGVTSGDQEPVVWTPSVRGSPHLFVLGIPGQGKSWTVTRLLTELHAEDVPAVVFDFHGQFGDPSGLYARRAHPTVVDVSQGLPFSPFEADAGGGGGTDSWQSACFSLAEIFEYVCELGEIQRHAVYQALREAYVMAGFGREPDPRLPTIADFRARLTELEEQGKTKNVVARTLPLLDLGLFREDITEPVALLERIGGGIVFDVHGLGLETVQLAAGAFVLRKIYKDMFRWGEAERLRFVIVLDEAHRLARDVTLPKIMKEGRKFGVGVVVASQNLGDFHPDVLGNAGTKVVFRTNYPVSRKVVGFLRPQRGADLADEVEQLDVGQALVQTPEMHVAKRVRMHPLPQEEG